MSLTNQTCEESTSATPLTIRHPSPPRSDDTQAAPLVVHDDLFSPNSTPTPLALEEQSTTAKAAVASSSPARGHSPAPLSWSPAGWNAASFTFTSELDDSFNPAHRPEEQRSPRPSLLSFVGRASPRLLRNVADAGSSAADEEKRKSLSRLAATAPPFVFSPRPTEREPSPPFARLSPLQTSAVPRHNSLPFPSSRSSSFFDGPRSAMPRFASGGQLIDHGKRYEIADEILRLQQKPIDREDRMEELSTYETPNPGDSDKDWLAEQQQYFNSMYASPLHSPADRSRSSSLTSTTSFFGSHRRPSVDRNATVQQLNSYFGPSPVDTAPAILPAGFDTFSPQLAPYSPQLSRHSSISSLDSQVYPPLAHPEPFNLTPEDSLYIQAREIYTTACCSTLKATPPAAKLREIGEYFDKAMNQDNPLAALYGVNSEQTKGFYASPATSGLNEIVVKVAAMRGRQNQMLSVQRSAAGQILPGPSPNNRKLELYKTELCRSWEEKGSCRYGFKCQFAHGREEQRSISRHPKFKSELCRTFAVNGSCPYGPRCCFIHQALPGGSRRSSPPSSAVSSSAHCEPAAEPVSRLAHRMTSTAVAGAPARNFGPTLSSYIGSGTSGFSSAGNSPTQSIRAPFPSSSADGTAPSPTLDSTTYNDPFGDSSIGLGLSLKLGQAPPTHAEPARSRIHRYSLSSQHSSASLGGATHSSSSGSASPTVGFHPHARTNSQNSTFSSIGSQSSFSSSSPSSPFALRPIGSNWLENSASSHKGDVLDWDETEDLLASEDMLGSPVTTRFGSLALT
ncbi:uncharacterized protein JCM15063_005774 [Sporobolomyces koalae]|uniref:uncharacterized protein n=1 Tax=Sporobolomyces koalae TaxID=500713 RepID=UPI00316CD1AF